MAMPTLKHFINGQYAESKGSEYFDLISPVTGQPIARSPNANDADVDAAYAAASHAFKTWGQRHPRAEPVHLRFHQL